MTTRLRLLDDVTWEGRPVPGERTHALLRALASAGSRGLGESSLIDEIWSDEVPANPAKALQVVVSRARAATCPEAIERTARGYRLALPVGDVDVWSVRPEGLRLAAEGRYADALPLLEQTDPDDVVVAALLRAVAAVHGVPAALERYEAYRSGLADQLGIDPSPELRALHAELLARDRPVRTGLRFDADELVGRVDDIAALSALVTAHRVVSIVGAGGLGKTRLAHVIGRRAQQPVVHFVELAGVTSPEGVPVEVGDALGVRESLAGRTLSAVRRADLLTRIVDALGTAPTLLILDNCEHLIEAVADLVSLLVTRTPAVTVLTTSRAPLGLAAERVYLLPELSLDDAVRLFVERATATRPGVRLDDDHVRRLVAKLDGLPLAVELAAAKVRAMSVDEIERRLENRFALLRGGSRDAPERHQTLLAVIDWSWNLLDEEQRLALRRLSVFRDGFSLDGATAVIGNDALDVVGELADQSLIVVREGADVRYRLLETVREFGRMHLVDAGDDQDAEKRLRSWAVGLSMYAIDRLYSPAQIETMSLIRSEEGNLVDVLRRCLADRDSTVVTPLFAALAGFWTVEGTHLKVVDLASEVLELLVAAPPPRELDDPARMAVAAAVINTQIFRGGDAARGEAADRGLELLRRLGPGDGDSRIRGLVQVLLAMSESRIPMQPGALDELNDDPDPVVARTALMWSMQAYENYGDLAAARQAAVRALALSDDSEGPWYRAIVTAQLCGLALQSGDFDRARTYAEAAMPALREIGAMEDWAQTRTALALVAIQTGDLGEARRLLDEIAADENAQSVFGGAISLLCGRAELALASGEVDAGLAAYLDAVGVLQRRGIPGLDLPSGFEPWVMFPQSAAVAAHCRYGRHTRIAREHRDELLAKSRAILAQEEGFIDYPIVGCAVFALGAWEATTGDPDLGARLLACAGALAFNRMLPSLDGRWFAGSVDPARLATYEEELAGRKANELRPEAYDLVAQLAG